MTFIATDPAMAPIAGGLLTIDLDAVRHNYIRLAEATAPGHCAAVVKADAYGLGAARVAPILYAAGCRFFFVAQLSEGLDLRPALPGDATVAILNGLQPGGGPLCADARLIPVLNSLAQAEAWADVCRQRGRPLPAILQVDTGMSRLGFPPDEFERLLAQPDLIDPAEIVLAMSHLACADEPDHPANAAQRERFEAMRTRLPELRLSLANSAGLLRGAPFRHHLARPGLALYGVDPLPGGGHGLRPVARLEARVVQVRDVPAGTAVGYGASWVASRPTRLATVAVGYADGWPRHLSNTGAAYVDGIRLPIAGRVSMDSMTFDVTALPGGRLGLGSAVELIGPHQSLDDVAADAGTIPYEILTGLGHRYARRYLGEPGG